MEYALRAPAVNNAGQEDLLWVIGNERPKREDSPTKEAIGTTDRDRLCHARTKGFENVGKRGVVELLAKDFVVIVAGVLSAG